VLGPGALARLPEHLARLGVRRPLVVTDAGVVKAGLAARLYDVLGRAGLPFARFEEVQANPTDRDATAGLGAFRAAGCDGFVAIGGGSSLDAAKLVQVLTTHPPPLSRYDDAAGGDRHVKDDMPPLVAIPTTAGTGSEVGRSGVATLPDTGRKTVIFSPYLLPKVAICDPELTVGLPPALTAWTGLDALSHSLEALCAPGFHPMADGIATEAIRLIHGALEAAASDGHDLRARAQMLAAASMGAVAFQKGLGAMHAMAHAIGGLLDAHHGLTIAIVMPYVLEENRRAIEPTLARLGRALGLAEPGFEGVLSWVLALRARLAIPPTLEALGVRAEHIATLAPRAAVDPSAASNPLPLDEAAYAALLRRALAGEPAAGAGPR
jgi:alcohol dehydrogenase class IV